MVLNRERDRFGRKPPTRVLWGVQNGPDEMGTPRSRLETPIVDPTQCEELTGTSPEEESFRGQSSNHSIAAEARSSPPARHRRPRAPRFCKRPSRFEFTVQDGDLKAQRYSIDDLPSLRSRSSLQSKSTHLFRDDHSNINHAHPHSRNHKSDLPPLGPPVSRSLPNLLEKQIVSLYPSFGSSHSPNSPALSGSPSSAIDDEKITKEQANTSSRPNVETFFFQGRYQDGRKRSSQATIDSTTHYESSSSMDEIDHLFSDRPIHSKQEDASTLSNKHPTKRPSFKSRAAKLRQQPNVFTFDSKALRDYHQRIYDRLHVS